MIGPAAASVAGAILLAAIAQDIGEGVVLAAAVLAALAYIAKGVRKLVRTGDAIERVVNTVPARMEKLEARMKGIEEKSAEQNEQHEAAHAEMLSMVNAVDVRVEKIDERLDRIEQLGAQDHEHVTGLTRELGVPVRRPRDAA